MSGTRWQLFVLLAVVFVQCKSTRNHTASFGGGFSKPASGITNNSAGIEEQKNPSQNIQEPKAAVLKQNLSYAIDRREQWMPQKFSVNEFRKSVRQMKKIHSEAPAKNQGGSDFIGGLLAALLVGSILIGFFYLFFLLLTKLGWVSIPFWKALLYFIALVLFLILFMTTL